LLPPSFTIRECATLNRSVLRLGVLSAVLIAVLIAASVASAGTFTTLDAPFATQGTAAYGISGNNIVGLAFGTQHGNGFLVSVRRTPSSVDAVGRSRFRHRVQLHFFMGDERWHKHTGDVGSVIRGASGSGG
jgi:hypothetical protein